MRLLPRTCTALYCHAPHLAQYNCTEQHCAMRLKSRAPQLRSCSPLLPISRSLSSTGDQLPLPATPHLCQCQNHPKISTGPAPAGLLPSPTIRGLGATIRPAVAPRNHLGRAHDQGGRRGRELNGWMLKRSLGAGQGTNQPTRQQG